MERYAAIVLAGGYARRLGGVHKPGLDVGGVTLLDRVLAAVPDATPRVVVGPARGVPGGAKVVREEPPGGGPVAALAAGLAVVGNVPVAAVLAGDLPFLSVAVLGALRVAAVGRDGAVLVDGAGRDQYLAAVYRVAPLRAALADGDPAGAAMRRLVAGLDLARVAPTAELPPWFDCDDADDVRQAREWARREASDGPRHEERT